jgi:hypothetical protein
MDDCKTPDCGESTDLLLFPFPWPFSFPFSEATVTWVSNPVGTDGKPIVVGAAPKTYPAITRAFDDWKTSNMLCRNLFTLRKN